MSRRNRLPLVYLPGAQVRLYNSCVPFIILLYTGHIFAYVAHLHNLLICTHIYTHTHTISCTVHYILINPSADFLSRDLSSLAKNGTKRFRLFQLCSYRCDTSLAQQQFPQWIYLYVVRDRIYSLMLIIDRVRREWISMRYASISGSAMGIKRFASERKRMRDSFNVNRSLSRELRRS